MGILTGGGFPIYGDILGEDGNRQRQVGVLYCIAAKCCIHFDTQNIPLSGTEQP